MSKKKKCTCESTERLIFSCSGGSDVGEVTDRVARRLAKNGQGKMFCINGIGAHVAGMIESAKSAAELVAIDGCPVACARKTLEHAGFSAKFINLKEMGYQKGKTPCENGLVDEIAAKVILQIK
jgi:uncharacterized metal-binding protein